MSQTPVISWHGKLPSIGDFLKRRFPDVLFNQWSHWFQVGLLNWQNSEEPQSATNWQFDNAPEWNLLVPADVGQPAAV